MSIPREKIKLKIIELIESKTIKLDLLMSTNNMFSIHSIKYNLPIESSIKYLFTHRKSAPSILLKLLNISLIELFNNELFEVSVFNVFGCPHSTDIDIGIVVPKIIDNQFLILDNVYSKLESLGYNIKHNNKLMNTENTGRDIDIVQLVLDKSGNLSETSKGTKETQNMIYYTYNSHVQCYPPIFSNPIKNIELFDKIKGISKFILDNLEEIVGVEKYQQERINKKIFYLNVIDRINYTNTILSQIKLKFFNSLCKSLILKLCQCLIIYNNSQQIDKIYQKESLGQTFAQLYDLDPNIILAMLFRGKIGNNDLDQANIIFEKITLLYINMCTIFLDNILDLSQSIPFNVPELNSDISNELNVLYTEFLKSPVIPTNLFISSMEKMNPLKKLNQMYIINSNYDQVKTYLDQDFIDKHVDLSNQRTTEWLDKLNYYQCGKSSCQIPFTGNTYADWVDCYYNLSRGAIAEILISKYCDFNSAIGLDLVKFHCGFLVNEKKQNSIGIAPDLLLIDTLSKKIIPVEIKCIVSLPEYSSNLIREIKLARKQLSTCKQILGNYYYGYCLLVVMFIHLNNDKYEYTVRYNKVEFN